MICRLCGSSLKREIIDLGLQPPSNSLLTDKFLDRAELLYPLKILICESCFLVQTADVVDYKKIFSVDYPYFSSISSTSIEHARNFTDLICKRLSLSDDSKIIEVASNDGYLLQFFKERGFSVLGIEPSLPPAQVARMKGIEIVSEFMSSIFAKQFFKSRKKADLLIANNVLAHVPDLNDFISGLRDSLEEGGVLSVEFPHLLNLVDYNQFDTFYHEHFSYFSLTVAHSAFESHGLQVFDVEKLTTHGGSLRLLIQVRGSGMHEVSSKVNELLNQEQRIGICGLNYYSKISVSANRCREELLSFLKTVKSSGQKIVAYGAAAKGNTLFNYCGINSSIISAVADAAPFKQGKHLPGSHIKIIKPHELLAIDPDYIIILPWNIKEEITKVLRTKMNLKSQLVVAIPQLEIF